ncbi:ArnT family glycosyltransferase [Aquimonas sp.]|jgi:4-amino-4-deoxy-L-arabinose transferase-like glycosyltransferase|uniref:ArnT family glycosyltransferase n=1 Tax=Aquimonas sp. TaxID=1872588 RepID=UPI0037BE2596
MQRDAPVPPAPSNNSGFASPELRLACGLIIALAAVSMALRPLLPVDETRYLAVAWEMWWRGGFVLPWLNGQPYHHKPPLLFWLIHAGWAVGGVGETWPRLIGPLSALLTVLSLRQLMRRLWPQQPGAAELAPLLLFGSAYLLAYQIGVMFDVLMLAALSLSWLSLHVALCRNRASDWLLFALAGAVALLAKGPVALMYLLAPMLAWPLWRPSELPAGQRWPAAVLALILATLPLLWWALAASARGGDAFREALLFGQTLDRVSGTMGHPRHCWFFLPFILLLPLPWSLWPPVWRALRRAPALLYERPARFLLAPLLLGTVIHLGVAGKQVHYLIPLLALSMLLLARLLASSSRVLAQARAIAAITGLLLAGTLAAVSLSLRPHYPMAAIGAALASQQEQGRPLAYIGRYQGEFHYAGRLQSPLTGLAPAAVAEWARLHPDGRLLVRAKRLRLDSTSTPIAQFEYKRQPLYLLASTEFIAGRAHAVEPADPPDEGSDPID